MEKIIFSLLIILAYALTPLWIVLLVVGFIFKPLINRTIHEKAYTITDLYSVESEIKALIEKYPNEVKVYDVHCSTNPDSAVTHIVSFFSAIPYFWKEGLDSFIGYYKMYMSHSFFLIIGLNEKTIPDKLKAHIDRKYSYFDYSAFCVSAEMEGIRVLSPRYFGDYRNIRVYDRKLMPMNAQAIIEFCDMTIENRYDASYYIFAGIGLLFPFLRKMENITNELSSWNCSDHVAHGYVLGGLPLTGDVHRSQATPLDLFKAEDIGEIVFDEFNK